MRQTAAALLIISFALGASSCGDDERPLTRVFAGPTWQTGEMLAYQLRQRDQILGSCTLSVDAAEGPSRTRFTSLCSSPDGRYRDDRTVEADARTLQPARSERVIARLDEGTESVFTATYRETDVLLEARAEGKHNETTRPLPAPTERSPDPAYYDDVSLFWLVRGLPLAKDFEGAFRDVNAGNARVFTVVVRVTGTATVEVPAGLFETWEIEVKTESVTQVFWVERTGSRRVIRARIERDLYELVP